MSLHRYLHGSKHDQEIVDSRPVCGLSLPPIVENGTTIKQQLPSLREALRHPSATELGSTISESYTRFRMMESVLRDSFQFYSDIC
jgi:hypothetical protein